MGGAWTALFLQKFGILKPQLSAKRVIQFWFEAPKEYQNLPVFFQDTNKGPWMYGFPAIGGLVKLAFHNVLNDCHPDQIDRRVYPEEEKLITEYAMKWLPQLGRLERGKTCIYTMTSDEHFCLGPLKSFDENFYLASGFSGHGFKFAPMIGELVSHWMKGVSHYNIDFLKPERISLK